MALFDFKRRYPIATRRQNVIGAPVVFDGAVGAHEARVPRRISTLPGALPSRPDIPMSGPGSERCTAIHAQLAARHRSFRPEDGHGAPFFGHSPVFRAARAG